MNALSDYLANRQNSIPRMLVEALLIVVSILLAFGIDAWWEERRERIEEQEILLGLKQEFEQNQRAIENQVALHEDTLGSLEKHDPI